MINVFKCFWYVDGTHDDWPMTIEADGLDLKSITIPVQHENGESEVLRFVRERTCHRAIKPNCMVCSECHYVLNDEWLYCPHCGARIEVDQDARDLLDAIASDDGRRYSMGEVMDLMEGGE